MTTAIENDTILCPHCGAEPIDDDDLCRFCGKVMVPSKVQEKKSRNGPAAGLRALKAKITPLSKDEFQYWDTLDLSDPSDPIWDD